MSTPLGGSNVPDVVAFCSKACELNEASWVHPDACLNVDTNGMGVCVLDWGLIVDIARVVGAFLSFLEASVPTREATTGRTRHFQQWQHKKLVLHRSFTYARIKVKGKTVRDTVSI